MNKFLKTVSRCLTATIVIENKFLKTAILCLVVVLTVNCAIHYPSALVIGSIIGLGSHFLGFNFFTWFKRRAIRKELKQEMVAAHERLKKNPSMDNVKDTLEKLTAYNRERFRS